MNKINKIKKIITKHRELRSEQKKLEREVNEFDMAKEYERLYTEKKKEYQIENPSESKIMTTGYYDYDNTYDNDGDHFDQFHGHQHND